MAPTMAIEPAAGPWVQGEDAAMDEQTLVYWLNSLPVPSALLVSSIQDLDDGSTIIDIVKHFFPEAEDDGEPLDLQRALAAVAAGIGSLPQPFEDPKVAYANILGGGHYALCWIAAVLRFCSGDGPPLGFKGQADFRKYVDMGGPMDQVGSPRREWGMANSNGSPQRERANRQLVESDALPAVGSPLFAELREAAAPLERGPFGEVWRKTDGRWRPERSAPPSPARQPQAEPGASSPRRGDADGVQSPRRHGERAQAHEQQPSTGSEEGDMREASATAVLSKRGVGRPAQHDGDWNSSTKIERRKSLPPPRASTQLLLADAEQAGEEDPLWARRGQITARGLLVGSICDPAPGSSLRAAKERHAHAAKHGEDQRARAERSAERRKKRDLELGEERLVELDTRAHLAIRWLQTMPLELGALGQVEQRGATPRDSTLPKDAIRKAFGPGRLVCQLVNVLNDTRICTR